MKLLKLLPLFVFIFAFNLYAQSQFFGSVGTKYYTGILVKTEDGEVHRAIVEPIISHETLLKKMQEQYGRVVEILWMGEVEAVVQKDGKISIPRVNETAGAIQNFANGENVPYIVGGVETTSILSTKDLYDNPGLGIGNLKAFNDAKADVEGPYFENTDYIKYNDVEKHLDNRLECFSKLRHDFISNIRILKVLSDDHGNGAGGFKFWSAVAKQILYIYGSATELDASFDTQEWREYKAVLKPAAEANDIESVDMKKFGAATYTFTEWYTYEELPRRLSAARPCVFCSSEATPRTKEVFAKSLDNKRRTLFEDFNTKPVDDILRELDLSYTTTLLRWNKKITEDYDTYMITGELPNKYILVDKEVEAKFTKTLDAKSLVIFKERVIANDKKTEKQLAMELGTYSANIDRWESRITRAYDEYLKTGALPNKYALLDSKVLGTFANQYLLTSLEKYILYFRIASSEPEALSEISKKFKITYYGYSDTPYNPPYNNLMRKEKTIKGQLDAYLENPDLLQDEKDALEQNVYTPPVTNDEIQKVNDMLLTTPEEIKFDPETIDLFKRYIKYSREFNPNAASVAEATLLSAKIPIENEATVETQVYVQKEREYNEKSFREAIIPFLVRKSVMNQEFFKDQDTDALAKMAIQLIVDNIDKLDSYDFKALISNNGVISYLENRANNLAKGTDIRMAYVFALDIFFDVAEAKGPAYLSKVCKVDSRDFLDTKARVDLIVKEQSADPEYKAKFLDKTGKVEKYEKLKRMNSSTFRLY